LDNYKRTASHLHPLSLELKREISSPRLSVWTVSSADFIRNSWTVPYYNSKWC